MWLSFKYVTGSTRKSAKRHDMPDDHKPRKETRLLLLPTDKAPPTVPEAGFQSAHQDPATESSKPTQLNDQRVSTSGAGLKIRLRPVVGVVFMNNRERRKDSNFLAPPVGRLQEILVKKGNLQIQGPSRPRGVGRKEEDRRLLVIC